MEEARLAEVSRRLRARCDAILGAVFFMPEAVHGYPGIGLHPGVASIASRAACMGAVPGAVAAAAFAPLEPTGVAAGVNAAWPVADPDTLLDARLRSATAFLAGLVGEEPEGVGRAVELLRAVVEAGRLAGHPVYAGLRSLDWPDSLLARLWRACDMVREHRGDSHVNAFVAAGVTPVEVNLLSELWRGAGLFSITVGIMRWPQAEADAALDRLRSRGWVDGEGDAIALTPAGKEARDEIERATDRQEQKLVDALGDDVDELFALLEPWSRAVAAIARPWWQEIGAPAGHP